MRIKIIIQYLFYPIILGFSLLGGYYLIHILSDEYLVLIPLVLSLGFIFCAILAERFIPFCKAWNKSDGDFSTDLLQTFLTLPLATKLGEILLPLLLYYPLLWCASFLDGGLLSKDISFGWTAVITLLTTEFCFYWMHRISHALPSLWRFHVIHHGAERLYWANSGRFHFIDAFLTGLSYAFPILILGVSPEIVAFILSLSAISGFMEHVNVNFRAGVLNYIFNTAELHRWHHSETIEESNTNFGKVLIVWDHVFRTYYWPKKVVDKIGVSGEEVPKDFIGQLKYPFKN